MERYRNLSGRSGVAAYELGDDRIAVVFVDGARYLYTQRSAGARHVAQMQRLAVAGRGLSGYISRHVRERYERKD
ncbi:hypothetical protein [Lysobacter silvisoli]|uniref:KTSC domain-containing protein n=1 Tax=Lysobacter silvisoli TaxID=2293254 RepID=A0A371JYB1_9GAMM|nr:hypothetical protein [Lysobacter silvisoli]RDZ26624.1 hypothetical protein DX914_16720 [Lysobacter silvisoli]